MLIMGTQIDINKAKEAKVYHTAVAMDFKNAINAFNQVSANEEAQRTTLHNPALQALASGKTPPP